MSSARRLSRAAVALGLAAALLADAAAQVESRTRYIYDASGNVVRVETDENRAPPFVANAASVELALGLPHTVTLRGENLLNAELQLAPPDYRVVLATTSEFEATFYLVPTAETPASEVFVTVATGLGQSVYELQAVDNGAPMSVVPFLIGLGVNDEPQPVSVTFESASSMQRTVTARSVNPGVVGLAEPTAVLAPGETVAGFSVLPQGEGETVLLFESGDEESFAYAVVEGDVTRRVGVVAGVGVRRTSTNAAGPARAVQATRTRAGVTVGRAHAGTAHSDRASVGAYRGGTFGRAESLSPAVGVDYAP